MKLPIDPHLPNILQLLQAKQNVLVQSSPGSGKTTRIPPFLNQKYKKILVIEPRRIAAIYASSRIAEENKWELGSKVGYEVRFDSKRGHQTDVLFLTEALLAKKIISDPNLKNVDLIIFDEFHERSFWTDLSIGHIKELQILGSAIQMLFLSATIDKAPLISFFEDIGVIDIELPRFPIEVIYQRRPLRYIWNDDFENNLTLALQDIIQKGKKQILVFLPGLREIRNTGRLLENNPKFNNFQIEVLHGSIPLANQKSIVANESEFENRIILSTNIAESSLTISGVSAVLDTGLHREASYNSDYDTSQLSTRKISFFSAVQRQGRANRLGPGICFKMWTELDERSMEKAPASDIKKSSLFELGLHLIHLGHWPLTQFTWFESPGVAVLNELQNSYVESSLCENGKLTALGELSMQLNLSFENAIFLILSDSYFSKEKASLIISILESDYTPTNTGRPSQSTLLDALDEFQKNRNSSFEVTKRSAQLLSGFDKSGTIVNWKRECLTIFKTREQKMFLEFLGTFKKSDAVLDPILSFSYINRVCRRRRQDGNLSFRATTTNGKEVQIGEAQKANQLPPFEYFLNFNTVIDASQIAKCYSHHFIDAKVFDMAIRPFCKSVSRVEFSEAKQQFYNTTELVLRKLAIETVSTEPLGAQELKEKTVDILEAEMESLVFTIPVVEEFLNRVKLVNQTLTVPIEIDWIEFLELEVKKGLSLKNRLDWAFDLDAYLAYENQKLLKTLTPKELLVKDLNRSFRIQYPKDETPLIEARLQQFLGLSSHPMILNNQLRLKIVLLGPHGRPIQITNDLPGFWKTSYPEIRKEMKGRYPKHAWPEDPISFKN